ncbi:hypothetical protein MRX96_012388 [Rhipicephalus microplus]
MATTSEATAAATKGRVSQETALALVIWCRLSKIRPNAPELSMAHNLDRIESPDCQKRRQWERSFSATITIFGKGWFSGSERRNHRHASCLRGSLNSWQRLPASTVCRYLWPVSTPERTTLE